MTGRFERRSEVARARATDLGDGKPMNNSH